MSTPSLADLTLETPRLAQASRVESEAIRSFVTSEALFQPSSQLVGREFAALDMEWALTQTKSCEEQENGQPSGTVLLLHGTAGAGKSAFAQFLSTWWEETDFIESSVSYNNSVHSTELLESLLTDLERPDLFEAAVEKKKPSLLIVDQLHKSVEPLANRPWGEEEKSRFSAVIQDIVARGNHALLVTRSKEPWTTMFPSAVCHHLKAPSPYDASILAGRRLKALGFGHLMDDSKESRFVDCVNHIWQYNPLAMDYYSHALGKYFDSNSDVKIDTLFDQVSGYHNPIFVSDGDEAFRETMAFIKDFRLPREGGNKEFGLQAALILGTLASTGGVFSDEYFRLIDLNCLASPVGRLCEPDGATVRAFLSEYLLPSGWLEETEEIIGVPVKYFRILPVFLNALRAYRKAPIFQELAGERMDWNFTEFLIRRSAEWDILNPRYIRQTELEAVNLIKAFDMCLQDIKTPLEGITSRSNWGTIGCYVLIKLLWSCRSDHPLLSKDITLPRLQNLTDVLKKKVSAGLVDEGHLVDNLKLLLSVTCLLAKHYFMKNPPATLRCTQDALVLLLSHPSQLRAWQKHSWNELASCVLYWAFSTMYSRRNFVEALRGFRVVLRIARLLGCRDDGSEVDIGSVRPLSYEPAATDRAQIQISVYELIQRGESVMEGAPYAYSVALLRHAALTGIGQCCRSVGDTEQDFWDDKANYVFAMILCLWPRDVRSEYVFLTMDPKLDFDMRDVSLAALGLANQLPFSLKMIRAQQLRANGKDLEAKDLVLGIVAQCYQTGNLAAEYACQTKLAELAMDAGNLDEAVVSIDRTRELHKNLSGGPWIRGGETLETFDLCRYGAAYLQAGRTMDALYCFEKPFVKMVSSNYPDLSILGTIRERGGADAPADFVSQSVFLARSGLLCLLVYPAIFRSVKREPITMQKLEELDRLAVNAILEEGKAHWNSFSGQNLETEVAKLELTIEDSTISNGSEQVDLIEGGTLIMNDFFTLVGPPGNQAFGKFQTLCKREKIRAIQEGRIQDPDSKQAVDFAPLSDHLPSLEASIEEMPDYTAWGQRLIANELTSS